MCEHVSSVDLHAKVQYIVLQSDCSFSVVHYSHSLYFLHCSRYLNYRLYGFAGCFALGWLFSMIGCLMLFGGTSASNIRMFIVFFVFGNVIGEYFLLKFDALFIVV